MSVLNRYLLSQFFYIWSLCIAGFITLYTLVDFLEKITGFLNANIPFKIIIFFFIVQLPKVIGLMAPVATLVAVLVTLSLMARNSEIVAFKAGGVSLYKLSWPIAIGALFISIVMFFVNNMVAPRATIEANHIWREQVKGQQQDAGELKNIWIKGVKLIQHLGSYNDKEKEVEDISLFFFDEGFNLTKHLEAKLALYENNNLVLFDVVEKLYPKLKPGEYPYFNFKKYDSIVLNNWGEPPQSIGRLINQRSEELSIKDLWNAIERLKAEGYNPVKQEVDFQFRFSFSLISFIMAIVGLPLAFWKEKGGSIALGVTFGLIGSFAYLICLELAKSLGYAELLPPMIAAWLPNILFFLFGIYLFSYIRQ